MKVDDANRSLATSWLRLLFACEVPPVKLHALLQAFGTPEALLQCGQHELRAALTEAEARALLRPPHPSLLEATWQWLEGAGNRHLIVQTDAEFPALWRQIPAPPCAFFAHGRISDLERTCVAIVGSRNATPQGERDAYSFAKDLSDAGIVIASGLARGIDAAAHRGGLAGAARASVAVVGTGPDLVYPKSHSHLLEEIAGAGCVLSEFPPGTPPHPWNFPRRNRLISGLARGVLVVEAAPRSGSLGTAHMAAAQNREVFAVPGSIHSTLAKGCHLLIKEGAALVECADDILFALRMRPPRRNAPDAQASDEDADPTLAAMGFAPVSLEHLEERTSLDAATLAARLSTLEIAGAVQSLPGGWFQRVEKRVIE